MFNLYTDIEEKLAMSLIRMVAQACPPDRPRRERDESDGTAERTTMPYSAYSGAVYTLESIGAVTIIDGVYRVVTFKFNDGVLDWAYGRVRRSERTIRKGDK